MKKIAPLAILISIIAYYGCIEHPKGGVSSSNILLYSTQTISELSTNVGDFDTTINVTLKGDEFVSDITEDMFGTTDLPDGLDVEVTRVSATKATVRIFGTATDHSACGAGKMAFFFKADAFSANQLPISFEADISINYISPVLTFSASEINENTANNGSFSSSSFTVTTSNGGKFRHLGVDSPAQSTVLTPDTDYDITGLPDGVTANVTVSDTASEVVTINFTGAASEHSPINDTEILVKFTEQGLSEGFCASSAKKQMDVKFYRSIVMFESTATDGNLGGRSGADAICAGSTPALPSDYDSIRALVSFSGTDEIADMPSLYSVPTTVMVESTVSGVVASNWADLLDGTIDDTLNGTEVVADTSSKYWTGSDENGVLDTDNCSGWTTASGAVDGNSGISDDSTAPWLSHSVVSCDTIQKILCIGFVSN